MRRPGLHEVIRWLTLTLLATAALGCATPAVAPFEARGDVATLSEQESRLWTQADQLDEQIRHSGQIYDDPELEAYMQTVLERLYPELAETIRVRALKSPILNAFALPNGSLYVHIGLLARMDNEAQLATLLGHEAGHFVYKHSVRQQYNIKSATAFATTSAILGIPLFGDLAAISSIYGYSRDLEREADRVAYDRITAAGYDVRESVKLFEHLYAEMKALDEDEPVFFSSHPKLKERIDSFSELIAAAGQTDGRRATEEFLGRTESVRVAALEADKAMDRYKSMILVLEDESVAPRYRPEHRYYYLGEAYRLRGDDGDDEKARVAYQRAIAANPDFAPAHGALGILYFKAGELTEARPHLDRYLVLAPDAPDGAYVRQYLEQIKAESSP